MKKLIVLTLLSITFHATCMDEPAPHPQLQLEAQNNKKVIYIKGKLFISEPYNSATLQPKQFYETNIAPTSLHAIPEEPFIITHVIDSEGIDRRSFFIPARSLWNHDNGSHVRFTFSKNEESEYQFDLTCTNNPKAGGINFQQQFSSRMNNFYRTPEFNSQHIQEFSNNGIINNVRKNSDSIVYIATNGAFLSSDVTAEHGPKGISSEKKFIELMQREKISGNSVFGWLMQRQLGQKNKSTQNIQKTNPNSFLDSSLREVILIDAAENDLLDDCFDEFMANQQSADTQPTR